jgi:SHS2 domain-containing protein
MGRASGSSGSIVLSGDAARWEHFVHQGDIGLRGYGPTPAAAFEQAALALTAAMCEPLSVQLIEPVPIECSASDVELPLVTRPNGTVYKMATRNMLFGRYRATISGSDLKGDAWGEPIDVGRHRPAVEDKGATVAEISVARQTGGAWCARCVFDV